MCSEVLGGQQMSQLLVVVVVVDKLWCEAL
jgi:hypothetical protein